MLRGLARVQACYRTLLDVPRRTMPRWVRGEFTLEGASGRHVGPVMGCHGLPSAYGFRPPKGGPPSRSGVVYRMIKPLDTIRQGLVIPDSVQAVHGQVGQPTSAFTVLPQCYLEDSLALDGLRST